MEKKVRRDVSVRAQQTAVTDNLRKLVDLRPRQFLTMVQNKSSQVPLVVKLKEIGEN